MSIPESPYGRVRSVEELGRVVRWRREESGFRQADAAALAGVGARFLSELERGKPTCELGRALRVLERFGLEMWLVPRGTRVEDVVGSRAVPNRSSEET